MTEKTLERLENGERVSDDTLRKVAKAIGWDEETFIGPRYIPTPEEAADTLAKATADFEARYQAVTVTRVTDPRQFVAMFRTSALLFDELGVAPQPAEDSARLKALLTDWNDIAGDLDPVSQLEAGKELLAEARQVESKGYLVKAGVLERYGRLSPVTVVLVVGRARPDAAAEVAYVERPPFFRSA